MFLSKNYVECIRFEKKSELVVSSMNFNVIDRVMIKLNREELKIETSWKATNEFARTQQTKLKRLRKQKRFLKKRKQRMFDKNLFNIEELKRLKSFEKMIKIQSSIFDVNSLKKFFNLNCFFFKTLKWFNFFVEIVATSFNNF